MFPSNEAFRKQFPLPPPHSAHSPELPPVWGEVWALSDVAILLSLQEGAKKLLEQKCRSIVPIGLLYVGQREMAATTPDDGKLH